MFATEQENKNVQQPQGTTGQVNNQARTVVDIVGKAVNQPIEQDKAKGERLAWLSSLRITTQTQVEPEEYTLRVKGVGIFARRDIHAIKGKQKSGKSSVLKVLMAALLGGRQFQIERAVDDPVVLFLDTEQKAEDVRLVIDRLKDMAHCSDDYTDGHLYLYNLRRLSYDTLLADTQLLIQEHRPDVVFIDGLVDYIQSFNDEVQSAQLVNDLLRLSDEYNCAIVNALHENKAREDDNMRGHLGTRLSQKAATILQCRKEKGCISVTCPDARHETMPEWHIRYDDQGHIVDADEERRQLVEQQRQENHRKALLAKEARHKQQLAKYLADVAPIVAEAGGAIERSELYRLLVERTGANRTTVGRRIKALTEEGWLCDDGRCISLMNEENTSQAPF